MRRLISLLVLVPLVVLGGCSSEGTPSSEKGILEGGGAKDGPQTAKDGPQAKVETGTGGDSVAPLDFPPVPPGDAAAWACTPGEANMCNGFKTQYCVSGVCTPCPGAKTDCDRKDDCECSGVCDGTKCKAP